MALAEFIGSATAMFSRVHVWVGVVEQGVVQVGHGGFRGLADRA
jgi:hypothetical protein